MPVSVSNPDVPFPMSLFDPMPEHSPDDKIHPFESLFGYHMFVIVGPPGNNRV